jgi:hypothetical protein
MEINHRFTHLLFFSAHSMWVSSLQIFFYGLDGLWVWSAGFTMIVVLNFARVYFRSWVWFDEGWLWIASWLGLRTWSFRILGWVCGSEPYGFWIRLWVKEPNSNLTGLLDVKNFQINHYFFDLTCTWMMPVLTCNSIDYREQNKVNVNIR